ncbi:hypothetical protein FAVG1_08608 [Fusarium avenaceum]|nr:hypothetical protein FAVG1_08608 [Fusarium avenaceum]
MRTLQIGVLNELAFCEFQASVAYGINDTLNFALWLLAANSYSSRFMAVGNGGFVGAIGFEDMIFELNNGMGLAVAGSDAGNRASENGGGMGAPGLALRCYRHIYPGCKSPYGSVLLSKVKASVIQACDLNDGVEDKVIENPLACDFDISSLACADTPASEDALCLIPDQLAAIEAIYRGPYRSDSPKVNIYPGLTLGSEAGWSLPQVSGALSNAFTVPML